MSRLGQARAIVRALTRLALPSAAAALLTACAGSVEPQPTVPPVEVIVAPPEPAATVAPQASISATSKVAAPPPAQTGPPQGMAPPLDVTLAAAPAHTFSGAAGNAPGGITSIWGVGSHVFVAGPG